MNQKYIARRVSRAALPQALACGLLFGLLSAHVPAATPAEATKPVPIPQSEELAVRSAAGLEYRIFIYRPATPPPAAGYPVIYALDGNAWFEPLAHAVRLQARAPKFTGIAPAVIVGIAYPGDAPFNTLRRFFDFVPDVPFKETMPPGIAPPKMGGADQFLTFIRKELEPSIQSKVKIDRNRRTLFGHSLGCSFTLHVLFTQPQAFDNYVCGSPSLGFNGGYIQDSANRFVTRLEKEKIDATLLLYAAEYDEKLPASLDPSLVKQFGEQLARARIVTGARELHQKLAPLAAAGLTTTFIEIEGENHISEVPVLINRMLPMVLRPGDGE